MYFRPSHSRRVATLAVVTGSGSKVRSCSGGGGVGPARVTLDISPDRCRARAKRRLYFVFGREVRPSLAREAFCRCAQAFVMLRMPILLVRVRVFACVCVRYVGGAAGEGALCCGRGPSCVARDVISFGASSRVCRW